MFHFRNRLGKRKTERELEREAIVTTLLALHKDMANIATELSGIRKYLETSREGLEKNDMAILDAVDRLTTRVKELDAGLSDPILKKAGEELPTEAQIKREWFGGDDD